MPDTLEINGKLYTPIEQLSIPDWVSASNGGSQPLLTLKDDDLFLITDLLGNIAGRDDDDAITSLGLFCQDTRFLSRLELQFERRAPILLSSTAHSGFALSALCANPHVDHYLKAEVIGLQRNIVINGGLFEDLTITNYSTQPTSFEISLSFAADFIDLFEIRGKHRAQQGKHMWLSDMPHTGDLHSYEEFGTLTMAYLGVDGALRESRIEFTHQLPNRFEGTTAVWQIELDSHETKQVGYRLNLLINGLSASVVNLPATLPQAKASEDMEKQDWGNRVTRFSSDSRSFNQLIQQAEKDIYLLRQTFGNGKALSAGVPWFSTLFGRDSIIAASQTLLLDPTIACDTLKILADYQGQEFNDWKDEEPGKILHELRLGEMANCNEVPHTPYYGTVDATPLWLMLYADYYEWTNDRDTLDKLWPNALAAMEWIDRGMKETGYLTYKRRSPQGLPNQGWKDSDDCHVNEKGQLISTPIALCEPQAYAYAAKLRLSAIARLRHEFELAEQWQSDARALKQRFNRDFWMPEEGYYAFALDGDGVPAKSITSNPGHCLFLGILPDDRAQSVAERLLAPDMFSGWGIRTLSSRSPAYNPMGYHVGSVWPHDNSLIAVGLRSLGFADQALEIAQGIFDMTLEQPYYRPPELFCGHERTPDSSSIRYPVACSPQAWASGAIFQLLQMSLNLVPHAPENTLLINNPTLPKSINQLTLENFRVGGTVLDLEFERSGNVTACRVVKKRGNLRVVIEA